MDLQENRERMRRGELYHAFVSDLTADRARCASACRRFNNAGDVSRRQSLELWKDIVGDTTPLPPASQDPAEDDKLLAKHPWIEPPIRMDYGYNVKVGEGAFINFDCVIIDTCLVTIGARTLFGPKVSLYSGTHPLDPAVRNGTEGPESGKEIHIGEDCWLAGNVTVLPGVTIGKGAVIGAGSVVTKDVPAFHLAVGNPARVIRKIETSMKE
ncbi:maltose acetyltransferase [Aspergillus tubingensis]|uniref:Acetyltransferase, CysE/LacA/LpxA/NodL family n=1 Tax=Aspergillus niger TaxID=5061 RepID=A0A100IPQ0_ASPNG|nr:acetyltransferase, CysE/LacA/LpxA/NodL family [Aspergillus tubingensis]GAQ45054.1 acetyltransferase, CysE/LacA/LpxA/NodL family [Aspergillus niger]GFN12004.1 acetyltransferase, CysE/LacA/LpxA/NodL family [Aspergillus tubingensis]GLA58707.1 maltose acetyltransferase [Aspergillus tubingensis]GLA73789.1 maltose acetyltransferase [Aspergillus tubingensis]GLB20282.1 maltose acetyltransferase [Aspergillus tubingensis]